MKDQEIRRLLLIIASELTTPLIALRGFCELLQKDTKSFIILEQATNIKNSVDVIQVKKLQLLDLTRTTEVPIFSSPENAVRYLHEFARGLSEHEENIARAVSQITGFGSDDRSENLNKDIHHISIQHKRLNAVIRSIKTIKSSLELENL